MMTPIEHAPALAYDSARQTIMPPPPIQPEPLPLVQNTPVQESKPTTHQGLSSDRDPAGGDLEFERRTQVEIANKMRAAWNYLRRLKAELSVAIADGHTATARRVTIEAADVASSIEDIARKANGGSGTQRGTWLPPNVPSANGEDGASLSSGAPSGASPSSSPPPPSIAEIMVMAKAGVDIAQEVVFSAAALSDYAPQDRLAVDSSVIRVRQAVVGVEALIGKSNGDGSSAVGRVDMSA